MRSVRRDPAVNGQVLEDDIGSPLEDLDQIDAVFGGLGGTRVQDRAGIWVGGADDGHVRSTSGWPDDEER